MTLTEAFQILGLPAQSFQSLTKEKLRATFKELVMKVHPDRGGNPYLFDLVQQAYEVVLSSRRDFAATTPARVHDNYQRLRDERGYSAQPSSSSSMSMSKGGRGQGPPPALPPREREQFEAAGGQAAVSHFAKGGGQFDLSRFNQVFADHYEQDEDQKRNYNDFLKSEKKVTRDLVVYEDPEEFQSRTALAYTTLGGTQGSFTSKHYTDLYEAYSEKHPDEVQGRAESYNNLDELVIARGRSIDMTDQERERHRRVAEMRAMHESSRQRRAVDEESRINDQYQRLNFRLTHLPQSTR